MADKMRHIFTSESVSEGHPDKMADQISDAVLDAVLADDPTGRVACEVLVTTGTCIVAGGNTTHHHLDVSPLAPPPHPGPGCKQAPHLFGSNTHRRPQPNQVPTTLSRP